MEKREENEDNFADENLCRFFAILLEIDIENNPERYEPPSEGADRAESTGRGDLI